MVYKQILVPDKTNHSIGMPEEFFGKKVEVIVVELDTTAGENHYALPEGKKTSSAELLEYFGKAPDFPTQDEIRSKAWLSKW
jgi:hypothetical protein